MGNIYIILFLFSFMSLQANYNFNSDKITFNTKKVTLEGDVKLNHDFGSIECDKVDIHYEGSLQNAKKIVLYEHIKLDIPKKCHLLSDKAELDLHSKEAFFSSKENPIHCVFYKQENNSHPLPELKTQKLHVFFNALNEIEKLIAIDEVLLEEKKYTITGDHAIYDDKGIITICPGKITFNNQDSDLAVIEASKLILNTDQKKIFMQNVFGKIDMKDLSISFKSDELIFDEKQGKLELLKNIEIFHEEFIIFNDSSVCIQIEKNLVENVVLNGMTTFKHLLKDDIPSYSLMSDGNLLLDPIKMQIVSRKNLQQIQFKDQVGQVFGDFLTIDYEKSS